MPRRLNLPDSASVAQPDAGGKLYAPSAGRNAAAICDLVARFAPTSGAALEIASGTGQHSVALARALPDVTWQPTEIDAARRDSIDAYVAEAGLGNIRAAISLDATSAGWAESQLPRDLIFLSNLLHLVSAGEAQTLVGEAAKALGPNGVLIIYGPFRRKGGLTSDGDVAFDAALRAQDPEIGYKADQEVIGWGANAGLEPVATVAMPANNLGLVWRRQG